MKIVEINIDSVTQALVPRKVGRFLLSGKLEQNVIEEDLEELKENEVELQKEERYNELQCHMCSDIFTNVESLRNHVREMYNFCVNCSILFFSENDLKMHKKKCNMCEKCGKEKHDRNCIKRDNEGN